MIKYFNIIIAITCAFISVKSFAGSCQAMGSVTVSPQSVIIQRDIPAGTKIGQADGVSVKGWQCTGTTTWQDVGTKSVGTFVSNIDNKRIYETNIPGVGYAIGGFAGSCAWHYVGDGNGNIDGNINQVRNCSMNNAFFGGGQIQVLPSIIFYKTGATGTGIVTSTKVGSFITRLDQSTWQAEVPININSFSVTTVACSIRTPALTFPIGNILSSYFGSTVGTIPSGAQNTQNLGLDCDAGANINVSLQGTQNPDVSTTSVLALTGQGNADVAKGVGVQLLYNGAPLVLNNRIVLKQSAGGQETFPITARYYQTKTSVSTGRANAAATLDLTYQ